MKVYFPYVRSTEYTPNAQWIWNELGLLSLTISTANSQYQQLILPEGRRKVGVAHTKQDVKGTFSRLGISG